MADGRPMGGNAKAFVNIRPVRPGEAEPLYAVWRASVEATHDFLDPDDLEFYARFVREEYLPGARLTVAVDGDGRPVAFMGVSGDSVDTLFVHPDWRGQGVGRLLLECVLDKDGVVRVDVNVQNEQAVGFYERMGFRQVGRSEADGFGKPYPLAHMRRG